MLFYILIVPSIVFTLYMLVMFRKLKKHDDILFRFCPGPGEMQLL